MKNYANSNLSMPLLLFGALLGLARRQRHRRGPTTRPQQNLSQHLTAIDLMAAPDPSGRLASATQFSLQAWSFVAPEETPFAPLTVN